MRSLFVLFLFCIGTPLFATTSLTLAKVIETTLLYHPHLQIEHLHQSAQSLDIQIAKEAFLPQVGFQGYLLKQTGSQGSHPYLTLSPGVTLKTSLGSIFQVRLSQAVLNENQQGATTSLSFLLEQPLLKGRDKKVNETPRY